MKLIIDAYNILKQISSRVHITEKERTQFIKHIVAYARQKRISVMVVFDGAPEGDASLCEQLPGVVVIYAGHQRQADLFIQKYIEKFKEYEFLLVSSDRQLCRSVASYRVESIDALDFYQLLQLSQMSLGEHIASIDRKAVKLHPDTSSSIDALMEEAAGEFIVKDQSEHDEVPNRASASYTPSKKERALLKKIRKL